jgi:hypothetical protein
MHATPNSRLPVIYVRLRLCCGNLYCTFNCIHTQTYYKV